MTNIQNDINQHQSKPVDPDNKTDNKPNKLKCWLWKISKYLILFLVIYTVINWWRQPIMPADPELQLTDYQGQQIDIDKLSRKSPVLVYFWGTWCPVCSTTSPKINSLAESSDYPVVSIAIQSGSDQDIEQYLSEKNYTFTTVNDASGSIFDAWQGKVTPSYVIIKQGEMTQGLTGIQPEWSLKLRLWLASLF